MAESDAQPVRTITTGASKRSGRMEGSRGGYAGQLAGGAGVKTLTLWATALAKRHPQFATQFTALGQQLSDMVNARTSYEATRREARKQWAPHPVPLAERIKVGQARTHAQSLVHTRAQQAQTTVRDVRAVAEAAAAVHRPKVSRDERADARARLASLAPGAWKPEEVAAHRARLVRGAIAAKDHALADELLFSQTLDTLQHAAAAATISGGVPNQDAQNAARSQERLWTAERVPLIRELTGHDADATAAIDAWRQIEDEVDGLDGAINDESGRMLAEDWPD